MAASAGAPAPAGYSGTPLAKKLGVHAGSRVCATDAPFDYRGVVLPWTDGATLQRDADRSTDIVEDAGRAVALPLGWVDVKVCAVDAIWSGLKLVVRRELRA